MERMVLRAVYLDPDIDRQIRDIATARGLDRADLFRRCLASGMKIARAEPHVFAATAVLDGDSLVFRNVYLRPKIDDTLRVQAFDTHTSKNSLIRRYVRLGMSRVVAASGA